jgi:hypothetical protein
VLVQTIVPFLFTVSTLCATASTLAGLPPGPWYPASVLAVGALHCGYGATRTKDLHFFLLLDYPAHPVGAGRPANRSDSQPIAAGRPAVSAAMWSPTTRVKTARAPFEHHSSWSARA